MKGKFVGFVVLLVFSFFLFSCYAQSSNNEQRLIGTWVDETDDSITVFNSDGSGSSSDGTSFRYGVAGDKLALVITQRGQKIISAVDFYISSDGKTLILTRGSANVSSNNGSLLRKKT